MFYDDFSVTPKRIYKLIKRIIFHWVSPVIVGLANIIFAQGLAGITIGILLILVGLEEYFDKKD